MDIGWEENRWEGASCAAELSSMYRCIKNCNVSAFGYAILGVLCVTIKMFDTMGRAALEGLFESSG